MHRRVPKGNLENFVQEINTASQCICQVILGAPGQYSKN